MSQSTVFRTLQIRQSCLSSLVATGLLVVGSISNLWAANPTSENRTAASNVATHKQVRVIAPELDGRKATLNTFCVGPDSNLWMCCEPAGAGALKSESKGAILIYSPEGKLVKQIPLSFAPQAINFAPSGSLFVSGSGKVARLSKEGEVQIEKDAPNIGNKEEMLEQMKKANEEQMKTMLAAYEKQLSEIGKQIAKLETPADDEDEKQAKRRQRKLKLLNQQKEQFEEITKSVQQSFESMMGNDAVARLMRSTGLTATEKDVFVSCPVAKGYGYTIYRMNHDLEEAKAVLEDVGGCCGQLDIQSDGTHLIVAENTAFQVGFYDRDGTRLKGFGKRSRDDDEGFGSCCNPMNVRCSANGEILTAESSIGHIKRFSADGEYLGFVGTASIGGGCKHVAIGFDSSKNWHYMMNVDRSNVAVLVPKEFAPDENDEERESREAKEGLGRKLIGTWEILDDDEKSAGDNYLTQMYGHLEFAPDGTLVASQKKAKVASAQKKAETEVRVVDGEEGTEQAGQGIIAALVVAASEALGGESDEVAGVVDQTARKWHAIRQNGEELEFAIVEDEIRGYGATVQFVSEKEIVLKWFYGDAAQSMGTTSRYSLISKDACGQKCGEGEHCEESK